MVFPTFFNLSLNLTIRSSWSEPQSAPSLVFAVRLIIFFAANDGEALYSQQKQDRKLTVAQDHELLIAKFRLKLKKVEKTTKPLRYDLDQIPYDYTVEVRNIFKRLYLIDKSA